MTPYVAFVAASSVSLVLSHVGVRFEPDVTWLTAGPSLFPSPVGTAVGALGVDALAFLHAISVGLIFAGLVVYRPPLRAVVGALPVLVWLGFLGVDAIAAVVFVAAFVWCRGWVAVVAGAVHLQTALLAVPSLATRYRLLTGLLLVAGVLLLLVTPYRNILAGELELETFAAALLMGCVVTAAALAPGALGGVWRPFVAMAVVAGACSAFVSRAEYAHGRDFEDQLWGTLRYALPVVLLSLYAAARVSNGRTERPTTAPGTEINAVKRVSLVLGLVVLGALLIVPAAFAQTVPAVPVDEYGDALLSSLATAIGTIFPYAAAITAFAIAVGMVKRWLGHRKATRV